MTGSEWFTSRRGGLNRYFEELFTALRGLEPSTQASAFGTQPLGGHTWGSPDRNLLMRIASSPARPGTSWDVIDQHFALYGRTSPRMSRKALMVTHFHGPWADESAASGHGGPSTAAKKYIESRRYQSADVVITLSNAFKSLVVENYGVPESKVSVVPGGVDVHRFNFSGTAGERGRVLCVRRLEKRMGIEYLIQAWPAILSAAPHATLHIVGDGTQADKLKRLVSATGVESSVRFLGGISDARLEFEYAAAEVTVVPSVQLEGFGLIALESFAQGRPVVATAVGGLPEVVGALDPTMVVAPAHPDALAGRITSALNGNRPDAHTTRRYAEAHSWTTVAQAHLEIYRNHRQTTAR